MSKFYVGQRVRIVGYSDLAAKRFIGMETTVPGQAVNSALIPSNYVAIDDGNWCFYDDQLEPITDCYDTVSWETCAWQPDHLSVPA